MRSLNSVIRDSLARHSGVHPAAIRPEQHLERDLDLSPIELVLVTLDVEDIEDVEISVEGLARLETVADLLSYLTQAVVLARRFAPVA